MKKTLEESLALLKKTAEEKTVLSIGEILDLLSGKGRALLLIILSLPFCLPLQIPGLSTPFGIVIAFLGIRIAFGKHLWVPKSVLQKEVSAVHIEKMAAKTLSLVLKMQRFTHARMHWVCHNKGMQVVNGLLVTFLGLFLALPLPIPFSNLAAAWPLLFMSIGLLEDDGIFVLASYLLILIELVTFLILGVSIEHYFKRRK